MQNRGGGGNSAGPSDAERKQAVEQQEKMKDTILSQVLAQDAMARLSTLRAAKPERAAQVEGMLVNMARSGRISSKMNDEQFRGLLDQISGQTQKKTTTVKFDRRRAALDSDDEEDED
uniref:Programmed cell death protein 5 n=1 Tax=Panagrolaimus superbus TaxID=310955 RepID=A0A914Y0J1_9BILA